MALTFPSDPINGAVSGEYTYDATKGAWRKNAAYPTSVTHSDVAPSNPREGDQWWKSNEGTLFTYYNDGTSSQWVESTNVVASSDPNPIPAGAMMAWASNTIPANWLLCDGSAVSRSTYASLFASIGTTYGTGDGTSTFNLPNLKGRTIVGKDSSQTEFDTLGETGGAKTHTLTTSELPSHTHTNTLSNATVASSAHRHDFKVSMLDSGNYSPAGPNAGWGSGTGTAGAYRYSTGQWQGGFLNGSVSSTGENYNAASARTLGRYDTTGDTSGSSETITVGITNASAGSDGAHNNLQPYIVLNYIIKFSAGETPGDSQLAVRVGAIEAANNATPLSPNYVINGGFDIWQRGTSFTTTAAGAFTADRWLANIGAGATVVTSRQDFTPGTAPVSGYEGTYYCRVNRTVTGSAGSYFTHKIEDVRTISNKTITVSFWAKASSNMSFTAGEIYFWNVYGTGGSSATGHPVNNTATNITTAWQRFSYTLAMPNLSGKTIGANSYSEFAFYFPTALSTFTFDIWGVQVEEGSYATPFRRNAPSIQAELAGCQRYYYRVTTPSSSAFSIGVFGVAWYSGGVVVPIVFPVTMRTAPTSLDYQNIAVSDGANARIAITSANLDLPSQYVGMIDVFASGLTAYRSYYLGPTSGNIGYIGFSAEL